MNRICSISSLGGAPKGANLLHYLCRDQIANLTQLTVCLWLLNTIIAELGCSDVYQPVRGAHVPARPWTALGICEPNFAGQGPRQTESAGSPIPLFSTSSRAI